VITLSGAYCLKKPASINKNLFWGNVKKSRFWLFVAEVGQDPLPVFLAHLRIDRLGLHFQLVQVLYLKTIEYILEGWNLH
jgi:hypothetical protein